MSYALRSLVKSKVFTSDAQVPCKKMCLVQAHDKRAERNESHEVFDEHCEGGNQTTGGTKSDCGLRGKSNCGSGRSGIDAADRPAPKSSMGCLKQRLIFFLVNLKKTSNAAAIFNGLADNN